MRFKIFRSFPTCALVAILFGAVHICSAAPNDDPAAMIRTATEEVLSIAYSSHSSESIATRVRPALDKYFAFDLVTRQAMGPGWRTFSPAEQKHVSQLFSDLIVRTYSNRVIGTQRPRIEYGAVVNTGSDRCELPTRVRPVTSNDSFAVIYRLVKLSVGWRIYDVVIEGVSFVANYRAQFAEIIEKGGAPAVIRALESKLASTSSSQS
jgi:phospholipid transport system substrate-binding protein